MEGPHRAPSRASKPSHHIPDHRSAPPCASQTVLVLAYPAHARPALAYPPHNYPALSGVRTRAADAEPSSNSRSRHDPAGGPSKRSGSPACRRVPSPRTGGRAPEYPPAHSTLAGFRQAGRAITLAVALADRPPAPLPHRTSTVLTIVPALALAVFASALPIPGPHKNRQVTCGVSTHALYWGRYVLGGTMRSVTRRQGHQTGLFYGS